jgi:hypothetical protein
MKEHDWGSGLLHPAKFPNFPGVSPMKKIIPTLLLGLAAVASLPTYATPIATTIDLDTVFTGAAPSGSPPWLTATFTSDTTSNTGILTLTSKLSGSDFVQGLESPNAAVGWAFFLDTGITSVTCTAGNNCADSALFDDTFNGGPVGNSWNLAFGWDSGDRFGAGDTAVYSITFDSILAGGSPFATKTDANVGGWLSVAHVQGIGNRGCSGWIVGGDGDGAQGATEQCNVVVPEPSVLGMFGLGTLMIGLFVGLRRRRYEDHNSGSF